MNSLGRRINAKVAAGRGQTWRLAAMACLLFIATVMAHAQPYGIDWFSIDGGGGVSTGGVYTVGGTSGQADAGMLSGGAYGLAGGFWGVIQVPGAPLLSVAHSNNTVVVFWPLPATSFVLDQTLALSSPPGNISWNQVAFPYQTNATHIFITVPESTGHKFYRLRKP